MELFKFIMILFLVDAIIDSVKWDKFFKKK